MMWKAPVLVLVLVLVVCVAPGGSKVLQGPTYGVKLCGREFIRAVIFTCGGSRWRRSTELLQDSVADDELWLADADILPSSPGQRGESEGEGPHESLPSDWPRQQEGMFTRPARSLITNEILEALRTSDRKGRDVVVGLSNACCKWGCSKSEISSLC